MIPEERRSPPMAPEHLALVFGSFERRLDAIAEKADQAWVIGNEAVKMHRETRALLEPHIANDAKFRSTLEEMKSLLERRKAAIMVGGWVVRSVRFVSILAASFVAAVFWLHDSGGRIASLVRDHLR